MSYKGDILSNPMKIFDRRLLRHRRDRAAADCAKYSVLIDETSSLLIERLGDVKKDFQSILDLGAHDGRLGRALEEHYRAPVVSSDLSFSMITKGDDHLAVVADEEFLPFISQGFDLVVSNLSLHWVNDLPGTFLQIRNLLRPEGLFMGTLIGGDSLYELRSSLLDAEIEVTGGVSPRLSPSLDAPTASALVQRAGFTLPVTDTEVLTLMYPDIYALMKDLKGMAATNIHVERLKIPTRRAIFERASALYKERFATSEGKIPATFEVIFLHGWNG